MIPSCLSVSCVVLVCRPFNRHLSTQNPPSQALSAFSVLVSPSYPLTTTTFKTRTIENHIARGKSSCSKKNCINWHLANIIVDFKNCLTFLISTRRWASEAVRRSRPPSVANDHSDYKIVSERTNRILECPPINVRQFKHTCQRVVVLHWGGRWLMVDLAWEPR